MAIACWRDAARVPTSCTELVAIAAGGHRELCIGQGAELSWMKQPSAITAEQVIEIFRRKTSPAFQVALGIGAALGGANAQTQDVLRDYSDALGVAYQIRDDLDDFTRHGSRGRRWLRRAVAAPRTGVRQGQGRPDATG